MGKGVRIVRRGTCLTMIAALGPAACLAMDAARTSLKQPGAFQVLRIETAEVTSPHVSSSPEGSFLVFSLLGHLFRLPAAGGAAVQLTSGFCYDSEPAVSPDGKRVAFISDRDASSGNVFVLELSSGQITPLTRESRASHPRWSPDGTRLAYFRHVLPAEGVPDSKNHFELKTVSLGGGAGKSYGIRPFVDSFYFADGRLGWAVKEQLPGKTPAVVLFKVEREEGQVLATADEPVKNAVVVMGGEALCYSTKTRLALLNLKDGKAQTLCALQDGITSIAQAGGGSGVYFGDGGQLQALNLKNLKTEKIPFKATANLECRSQTGPRWLPPTAPDFKPRAVMGPVLSPDCKRLVFGAAGFLFEQPVEGKVAKRLFTGVEFECDPAFSPDGKFLAYSASSSGQRHLKVHDFSSGQTRTLVTLGGASWAAFPSWSPDGTKIAFQRNDDVWDPFRLFVVDVKSGQAQDFGPVAGSWTARPHFSPDGRSLYYTAREGVFGAVFRKGLQGSAKPEKLTELSRHVNDSLVSPDGKWLAFRRNTELWLAPMGAGLIKDASLRRLTDDCCRSFSFSADASSVVYAAGNRVWRQPVPGGERAEIPIHLTLPRYTAPPLLIKRARVMDFSTGKFSAETSLMIQDGKIAWVGPEEGKTLPSDLKVLDAGGRFALPGLNDNHVHSAWANQLTDPDAFIAFGNTAVRDVGGNLDALNALRDRSESTALPLPRYWFSGEILEGNLPEWGDAFYQIVTEEEARTAVRKQKAWGSDFVKVYDTLPWNLQNVVAEEAQLQGMPLVGHSMPHEVLVRHARQGYASIEHTMGAFHGDAAKLLAATGTRWLGTLTCEGGSQIYIHYEQERMKTELAKIFIAPDKLKASMNGGLMFGEPREVQKASMEKSFGINRAAWGQGVKMRAGTDTTMTEVYFGLSEHWELEFHTMAGYSTLEALKMGTVDAAETVGASQLGELRPGYLGDILFLEANPLEKIQNTTRIWQVVKGGQVHDPRTLRKN